MTDLRPLASLRTELENPATQDLDLLETVDLVRVLQAEDEQVHLAVRKVVPRIAEVVELTSAALQRGGSIHLFGAGTSGRLGVLDASEIPPTFGAPPTWFQGHIAGGDAALRRAIEGAEDDPEGGALDVRRQALSERDVVIAISASGRTPYCAGALREAERCGARRVAIVCTEPAALAEFAEITIAVVPGPEAITGSTRLKAGSAQKMVLNLISTATMVRMGATYGNLMVGVQPTNAKLRDRAERLVARITHQPDRARSALDAADGDVRTACVMLHHGLDPARASLHLDRAGGRLRQALSQRPE